LQLILLIDLEQRKPRGCLEEEQHAGGAVPRLRRAPRKLYLGALNTLLKFVR
jgi:hypothetical protein